MDIHGKALDSMFDDMDDMETKKMFGETGDAGKMGGVSVTISVTPNGDPGEENPMNKGGEVCYSDGGMVKREGDTFTGYADGKDPEYAQGEKGFSKGGLVNPEVEDSEELDLPPFLRKKKNKLGA